MSHAGKKLPMPERLVYGEAVRAQVDAMYRAGIQPKFFDGLLTDHAAVRYPEAHREAVKIRDEFGIDVPIASRPTMDKMFHEMAGEGITSRVLEARRRNAIAARRGLSKGGK